MGKRGFVPSIPRLVVPLLLGAFLSTAALGQDSDLYEVKDSAAPCLKFRPHPDTDTDPIDCPTWFPIIRRRCILLGILKGGEVRD